MSLEDLYNGRIDNKDGWLQHCDGALSVRQSMQVWTWRESTTPYYYLYKVNLGLSPPVDRIQYGVEARPWLTLDLLECRTNVDELSVSQFEQVIRRMLRTHQHIIRGIAAIPSL
jgi:hypothetical protein